MELCKGRLLGISVAVAHGFFSGSLNILLKFLITTYHFNYLTLIQFLTSSTAALTLEILRRLGKVDIPPFSLQLAKVFGGVCILSTLQSTLTLWSLKGLSLPMYVVFKRCLPLVTLGIGVCILKNGIPSVGVITAVVITTGGAALAGAGDLTGDPFGYVTGVLAVIIHASYLVLIQKTSGDSDYGPLTAQYAIAIMAAPVLLVCSLVSMDAIHMWSYAGWNNPYITGIFVFCVFIGCAMNFTTLHCTYINSAVTTSFVGVVKSIATITVGMVAFTDVEPTRLFVAGVVVNTVGSIIYCVVKYYETQRKSLYQDLEGAEQEDRPAGQPYTEKPPRGGDEGGLGNGELVAPPAVAADAPQQYVMTDAELLEMQREAFHCENQPLDSGAARVGLGGLAGPGQAVSDSYAGVWRSVRNLQFMKKDTLIDNMEVQSP
ncbi:solute carrier family 35 member D3 [Osmerus mordax]|uniref:solute carrier family 35 member D3 n=1 Tax=Osmerus mordax TaxID=8014 RepID=UPI00350F579D